MLQWSLAFLILALVALVFGFTSIAGAATGIAKILFFVFIVLFLASFLSMTRSKTKQSSGKKYGRKASHEVEKAMHEYKRGELEMGRSGKKVTSRKQAVAIGLSQARRKGGKVPKKG
jgi:uncharacterized membrane protein YtjA (UPF0391 family)